MLVNNFSVQLTHTNYYGWCDLPTLFLLKFFLDISVLSVWCHNVMSSNNRNVVAVVMEEGKQLKCGGGGEGDEEIKQIEMW